MNVEYWGRVWLEAIALGRVSNKKAEGWDTPSIPAAALNHSTVLSEDYPLSQITNFPLALGSSLLQTCVSVLFQVR